MFAKLFSKKKHNAAMPIAASDRVRRDEGLPTDPDAPWLSAQRHHDDRFLRVAAHAENWRRASFISWAITALAVGGLTYVGSQSKIVPYLVEVDKLGRTMAVRAVTGKDAITDSKRLVIRELSEFIENARTVTADAGANNRALNRAFIRLSGAARGYAREELGARKPNEVALKRTIVVDVKTLLPVTDETWQVEWTETSYDVKGAVMDKPERWKANIRFELRPGGSEQELMRNPVGFEITNLSWTKQM